MKKYVAPFPLILVFSILSYAQIAEKLELSIYGGPALPVESSIGADIDLVQLSDITDTSFARILGIEESNSNFEEFWKPGFNLGAGLDYSLNNFFSLFANFQFNNFVFDDNKLTQKFQGIFQDGTLGQFVFGSPVEVPFNHQSFQVTGGEIRIYSITAGILAQYQIRMISPYLKAGGGYMRINQEGIGLTYFDQPFDQTEFNISFYDLIPQTNQNVLTAHGGIGLKFNLADKFRPFAEANYQLGFTENDNTILYSFKFGFLLGLN